MTEPQPDRQRTFIRLVLFLPAMLLLSLAFQFMPSSFVAVSVDMTGRSATFLSHLFGIPASYDPTTQFLTVQGFVMQIIFECTALQVILLLTFAFLFLSRCDIKKRILSALTAAIILLIVNLIRLVALGVIGAYFPTIFSFSHELLWTTLFFLLSCGLFVLWEEHGVRCNVVSRRMLLMLLLALVLLVILWPLRHRYLSFIAVLTTKMASIFFDSAFATGYGNEKIWYSIGQTRHSINYQGEVGLLVLTTIAGIISGRTIRDCLLYGGGGALFAFLWLLGLAMAVPLLLASGVQSDEIAGWLMVERFLMPTLPLAFLIFWRSRVKPSPHLERTPSKPGSLSL